MDSMHFQTFEPPNYHQGDDIINSLSSILNRPQRIAGFDNSIQSLARPAVPLERIPIPHNYIVNSEIQKDHVSTSPIGDYRISSEVSKKNYNAELQNQINDNNARKRKQMEAEIRESVMLQLEFENKSPWGREGCGAPIKKPVPEQSEPYMTPIEITRPQVMQPSPKKAPVQTNVHGEVTFARGGNSIFGTPKTDLEKQTAARYRNELEIQISTQNAAKRVEREKVKAEEDKAMREIKEYNDQLKKREEDEQRIQFEKERIRMEGIQRELEMRRHVLEERKKYVYKQEEVPTFCPREKPICPITFQPTKHVERNNDKCVIIEQNKQSKLLQRLGQFRAQLNSKKTQVENFISKQKKNEFTADKKVSKRAKKPKTSPFDDIILRPMSTTSITDYKENEILSNFWKISEYEGEFEKVELETFLDSEAFNTDVYVETDNIPKKEEPVRPNKRLVKQMKNLRQKIMGFNEGEYYGGIYNQSSNRLGSKLKLDSMTDIGYDGYSWLNPEIE